MVLGGRTVAGERAERRGRKEGREGEKEGGRLPAPSLISPPPHACAPPQSEAGAGATTMQTLGVAPAQLQQHAAANACLVTVLLPREVAVARGTPYDQVVALLNRAVAERRQQQWQAEMLEQLGVGGRGEEEGEGGEDD